MNDERLCRILIVDNELEYAAKTASKLEEIRPSLLNHNRLEIELTNNAYFVAERLRQSPAGQPPWDIIIADVYMPFPSRSPKKSVADCEAILCEFNNDNRLWPCWRHKYDESASLEESIDHGGFHIAKTVAELRATGKVTTYLKLILMSNCLAGEERKQLLAYQKTNKAWLKYYDKADWQREKLSAWPTNQLEPNVFQWALFLAIAERETKYPKDSIFEFMPDVQWIIGATVTPELDKAINEAWRLGKETEIETVLITGEVGTGREFFADLIHKVRMKSLGVKGALVRIDCSSITPEAVEKELFDCVEESAGGTLFIDEVDKLTPPHQGRLYRLLTDKRFRAVDRMQTLHFASHLAILSASGRNLDELRRSELFHEDLYYLLKDEQLHLVPLRERPADAVSIGETLAHQAVDGLTLSDCARKWIEGYEWSGNNKELRSVITSAARRALTSILTADDLEAIVKTGRSSPAPSAEANKDLVPEIKNFKAEPPFQLHWGDNVLIDGQKRPIPLAYDLHRVLKELLRTEEGQYGLIRGKLTFAEIADLYKSGYEEDHADDIARRFVHNLRRFLEDYGVDHSWLIKTWKGYGYKLGVHWAKPPVIYASEPSLVLTDDIEEAERSQRERGSGRKKKLSPDF